MHAPVKKVALLLALADHGVIAGHVNGVPSIYHSWGELSPYKDNAEDGFGVQYVGLPKGCQVVSQQKPVRSSYHIDMYSRNPSPRFSAMPSASQTTLTAQ
jgi:hypothetical protein